MHSREDLRGESREAGEAPPFAWKMLLGMGAVPVLLIAVAVFEPLRVLAFGWLGFLGRALPRVTVFWPSVIAAVVAIGLLLGTIHFAGRQWIRSRADESAQRSRWKLRWTVAILAGVFVLFGASIALVGLAHQIIWLATSDEPLRATAYKHWRAPGAEWNLRNHGQALFNWSAAANGFLPPGGSFDEHGRALHSWETHILPYIGYSSQINLDLPWTHPENQPRFRSVLPAFLNPEFRTAPFLDDEGRGLSHYAGNVDVLGPGTKTRLDQLGDAANTILVGEVNSRFVAWGHPVNWRDPTLGVNRSPVGFGGPRAAGGAHFLMADDSVRFVSERADRRVLKALSTPGQAAP